LEIIRSKPSRIMFAITELPPKLTNGSVTPVSGMNFTTPPMITTAWSAKTAVNPVARSLENPSRAITATLKPRAAINA
jgi:hypothetical protein